MFLISTGYLFLIHILIKEGLGAVTMKEPLDTNDIITKENMNREMQETQTVVEQQHQNQQISPRNTNIPQQIPMQQRNIMMQQQIQAQQNANMQQNQYKQNQIPLARSLQLPLQLQSQQLQIPSIQIRPLPPVRPLLSVTPRTVELIIQKEDTEQEKTDKANETLEKLMQFMSIMGQVDTYLSEKAQSAIKTIAHIAEESTGDTSSNRHNSS